MAAQQRTFKNTREILVAAAALHDRLKHYYQDMESRTASANPRIQMLLKYIDSQEKKLQAMLLRYRGQAPADILDAYFQYTPEEIKEIDDILAGRPDRETGVDQVLTNAVELDSLVQAFYRRAAQMAPREAIREIFQNLANAVEDKEREMVQSASAVKDL